MRRLRSLAGVAIAITLTGCVPGQSDYTESERVKGAYHNLVPTDASDLLSKVGVCVGGDDVWHTVIRFDDGTQYLYTLAADNSAVTLESVSTLAQRRDGGSYDSRYRMQYDCYDKSAYRFIYSLGLRAEVATTVMVNQEFGDKAKSRIAGVAMAVTAAMKAHASFVPKESTW